MITISSVGSVFYTTDCAAYLNGAAIPPGELAAGDDVEIIMNEDNHTIYISASRMGKGSPEGEIKDLDTIGTLGITVRDDEENTTEYAVVDDVIVVWEGNSIDFDELYAGDRVSLRLDSEGRVFHVEVVESNAEKAEGEIKDLDTIGDLGIVVRPAEGASIEYVVIDDVVVERDGDSIDFEDLDEGEWVSLDLDSRGRVIDIKVIEEFNYSEGTVENLVNDGSPRISILRASGTRGRYDIDNNIEVYRDDRRLSLEDVIIGSEVKVRADNDTVTEIEVTNDEDITLEGMVIFADEDDNRIRIEQVSGNRFTFDFDDEPIIEDRDGDSIDIEDIEEDKEARIELSDGDITRLTMLE